MIHCGRAEIALHKRLAINVPPCTGGNSKSKCKRRNNPCGWKISEIQELEDDRHCTEIQNRKCLHLFSRHLAHYLTFLSRVLLCLMQNHCRVCFYFFNEYLSGGGGVSRQNNLDFILVNGCKLGAKIFIIIEILHKGGSRNLELSIDSPLPVKPGTR